MKLESKKGKRKEKEIKGAKKIKSVEVKKQKSDAACEENKSFGIDGNKIWVDADCGADFKVCYKPGT